MSPYSQARVRESDRRQKIWKESRLYGGSRASRPASQHESPPILPNPKNVCRIPKHDPKGTRKYNYFGNREPGETLFPHFQQGERAGEKLPPLYNLGNPASNAFRGQMIYNLPVSGHMPMMMPMPLPSTMTMISAPIDDKDGHLIVNPHQILGSRYEMLETIGQGTFGKVVKCFDLAIGQFVAVKVVRAIPKYSESADYEIDVLTKIQNRDPSGSKKCTKILSCFRDRGHVCMVFPLFGPSLYDFMKRLGYVPFFYDDTWRIARQLLEALRFFA